MILAGDIGGTNARLALFDDAGKKLLRQTTYESRAHAALGPIVADFCQGERPRAAVLGVAGPVVDNRCRATNLPWMIDGRAIGRAIGVPGLVLVNDLVAIALGCLAAPRGKLVPILGGVPRRKGATMAVIAAGTGLGEALLVWDGARYVPQATEGSHVDFAPRTAIEFRLLQHLERLHDHVSYERVASASSLAMLHDFFRDVIGVKETAAERRAMAAAADPNAEVVRLAKLHPRGPSARALALFLDVYGAEAGNLVLKALATGGLFLCGRLSGILAPELAKSPFSKSFLNKGRMRPLLERTPVAVLADSDAGLHGSAYHARALTHR